MLLFLGIMGLVLSIIFFLVDKFDEHGPLITSLSRNNGYKKLQAFLLAMFIVCTPLGIYFLNTDPKTFAHFEHGDHYHFVNGEIGTVAILEDGIIKRGQPFETKFLFWNNQSVENLVVQAKHEDGTELELSKTWMLDTSDEAIFLKDKMDAVTILDGSVMFDKTGDWNLIIFDKKEKLGAIEIEVSE